MVRAHSATDHSPRSARTGSVRDARCAGIAVAIHVISTTTTDADNSTNGSDAWTPYTMLATVRPPAYADTSPRTTPTAASPWPRRIISQNTSIGVAPSASRVAIVGSGNSGASIPEILITWRSGILAG